MGNAGKFEERARARELRAQAWTLQEIADELGVSKGSVSRWVRDVEFVARPRNRNRATDRPHPLHLAKLAEIQRAHIEAVERIGDLTERDVLMIGVGLYAGEGSKTPGSVSLANTNPSFIAIHLAWLRQTFAIDESRLRVKIYLHEGLDLDRATQFWSDVTGVPVEQFTKPYRAPADATRRRSKHELGCATVLYSCAATHRRVMAMIELLSSSTAIRDSSVGRAGHC